MMSFVIGFLTVVLVLDCVFLILLVLIQLPKKEAGAGLAFGAGTTDALFGAGSGTALTRITKYAAGLFFALAIILSVFRTMEHNRSTSAYQKALEAKPSTIISPAPSTTAATTRA